MTNSPNGKNHSVKGRVLFLDDDGDTRELLDLILGNAGYEIVAGSSVADGLRLTKSDSFDFILMDWYFEDGTGIDLCRAIREFDKQTPIFFYTGMAYDHALQSILEAGAQGYFVKPVEFETLLDTISAQIGIPGQTQ